MMQSLMTIAIISDEQAAFIIAIVVGIVFRRRQGGQAVAAGQQSGYHAVRLGVYIGVRHQVLIRCHPAGHQCNATGESALK
eukprot:scaffold55193_cov15-Prasinocladus_malaysianus.AAC.1